MSIECLFSNKLLKCAFNKNADPYTSQQQGFPFVVANVLTHF